MKDTYVIYTQRQTLILEAGKNGIRTILVSEDKRIVTVTHDDEKGKMVKTVEYVNLPFEIHTAY